MTPQPWRTSRSPLQDGTTNSQRNTSYAAYAQATYAIWSDTRLTAGVRYTYDERHAHLDLLDDIFPATVAVTLPTVTNGVFDPNPVTYNGITYGGTAAQPWGQIHACAITNVNGVLQASGILSHVNIDVGFHKPTWTLAIDHDLWDGMLVYATTRSQAIAPARSTAPPSNLPRLSPSRKMSPITKPA